MKTEERGGGRKKKTYASGLWDLDDVDRRPEEPLHLDVQLLVPDDDDHVYCV